MDSSSLSWLITVYFVTYIPLTFPSSWLVHKLGFQRSLLLGSAIQTVGAGLRCIRPGATATGKGNFDYVIAGQVCIARCCLNALSIVITRARQSAS